MRIATPDLDELVNRYTSNWREQDWIKRFGYQWMPNSAHMLNVAMREWGHLWIYSEEELCRTLSQAGFIRVTRFTYGQSCNSLLASLEYREDSLIIEAQKPAMQPFVSILIPAFHTEFFAEAFQSALAQTYPDIEIVICDDSRTDQIAEYVRKVNDARVRYFRNPSVAAGGRENYLRCFRAAKGEYIKFLNDDDILDPSCVSRMARVLQEFPQVKLVTSARRRIDRAGNVLPDSPSTKQFFQCDALVDGRSAINKMLGSRRNFIGEPTTAMFRRRDADAMPDFMSFRGIPIMFNVDMAVWMHLLSDGMLVYLADRLSSFRVHPDQEQRLPEAKLKESVANSLMRDLWSKAGGVSTTASLPGRRLCLK